MTQTHRQVSFVLFLLLTAILVYSALYGPEHKNRPFPSLRGTRGGGETISRGLSRGFSAIIRLDFDKALQWNAHAVRIFVFVILQWLMRLAMLLTCRSKDHFRNRRLWITDVLFSCVLFLYAFAPLIRAWYAALQALIAP